MNEFEVRVYVATSWSLFTQADHFDVHHFDSDQTLEQFASSLMKRGFKVGANRWIMPAAILEVKQKGR